ncbi:MAG: hypothetical protein HYV08_10305 [Deltaproteobacteria bacterium]|nr:hypothetical protein [Deltaproteobacteria bacterium]MBI3077529.1 hypothetical protein [Deltaproteobacteria bacterium]
MRTLLVLIGLGLLPGCAVGPPGQPPPPEQSWLLRVAGIPPGALYPAITAVPGEPGRPLAALPVTLRTAVERGRDLWVQETWGRTGLACAVCHPDASMVRGWASGYPAAWLSDGDRDFRVKTLAEVIAGAVQGHLGLALSPDHEAVRDLEAFLAWQGDGARLRPGVSGINRPAEGWLAELQGSVERGRSRFVAACGRCHGPGVLAGAAAGFPAVVTGAGVLGLDAFIARHARAELAASWSRPELADLTAYVVSLSKGWPLRAGRLVRLERQRGRQ